jgi:hypothetical protein
MKDNETKKKKKKLTKKCLSCNCEYFQVYVVTYQEIFLEETCQIKECSLNDYQCVGSVLWLQGSSISYSLVSEFP